MRDDHWKLVIDNDTPCLFDLSQDIAESNDLSASEPDRVESMCKAIDIWKADVANGATPQPDRDAKTNS